MLCQSDSVGELGDGCREPVPRVDVKAEFIVAAVEILDERMFDTDHSC